MKAVENTDVIVCLKSFLLRIGRKRGVFIVGKKRKKHNRLKINIFFLLLDKKQKRKSKNNTDNLGPNND